MNHNQGDCRCKSNSSFCFFSIIKYEKVNEFHPNMIDEFIQLD